MRMGSMCCSTAILVVLEGNLVITPHPPLQLHPRRHPSICLLPVPAAGRPPPTTAGTGDDDPLPIALPAPFLVVSAWADAVQERGMWQCSSSTTTCCGAPTATSAPASPPVSSSPLSPSSPPTPLEEGSGSWRKKRSESTIKLRTAQAREEPQFYFTIFREEANQGTSFSRVPTDLRSQRLSTVRTVAKTSVPSTSST